MIIGLTGGSGTGKTAAGEYFRERDYVVIDSDKVARDVCLPGSPCLLELAEYFGRDILSPDGSLKRRDLGRIVFGDAAKLGKLNEITHKYIVEKIKDTIAENPGRDFVLDAPLLFEAGLGDVCDVRLCVLADKDVRIGRIVSRDGVSVDDARARIDSQKNDDFYIARCEKVIFNNGSPEELKSNLDKIFGGENGCKKEKE